MAYLFPLSIQLTLPISYGTDKNFRRVLELLQQYNFSGVELNIEKPDRVDPANLKSYLSGFGLRLSMFATGASAKLLNLSLSSPKKRGRKKSVKKCKQFIQFAQTLEAGIIMGFLKGPSSLDPILNRGYFQESLGELEPFAMKHRVPVWVEATNRYESAVANSVSDAYETISAFSDNPFLRLLPDTFHMNIEEKDTTKALIEYAPYYDSLHISDNNRFFPGFGGIDFSRIFKCLKRIDFQGGVGIEGNMKDDLLTDIQASMAYLEPLLKVK